MANNPYVNKVVYGNSTVMDISDTTAVEEDVASGKTFYKASGAKGVGSAVTPDISNCYQSTDSQETDIQDADYFPFYDSSATAKKNTLWSNIKSKLKTYFDTLYATYLGVIGLIETTVGWSVKNILNCDIASGTQTINGLTVNVSRTTGGDLVYVKVSGTATANTSIQVASSIYDTEYNELTGNKYILNGCPEGGSSSTYSLRISGNYGSGAVDTGSGALISSTVANAKVYIDIKNGYSASNLQFRPMIRSKYVTDATYEAYHPSVEQCKFDRAEQRVLGAKNILSIGNIVKTPNCSGVTVTNNGANGVHLTGNKTSGGWGDITFYSNTVLKAGILYKIQCLGDAPSNCMRVRLRSGASGIANLAEGETEKTFSVPSDTLVNAWWFTFATNDAVSDIDITIYPMVILASDPDDTYVPYAMTNRELTEIKEGAFTSVVGTATSDCYIRKQSNVVDINLCLNDVTSAASGSIATIPVGFRPPRNNINLLCYDSTDNTVVRCFVGQDGIIHNISSVSGGNLRLHSTWITT